MAKMTGRAPSMKMTYSVGRGNSLVTNWGRPERDQEREDEHLVVAGRKMSWLYAVACLMSMSIPRGMIFDDLYLYSAARKNETIALDSP